MKFDDEVKVIKNRKNYLKARKKQFKWNLIGWYSDAKCPICGKKTTLQIDKYDAWCCISCNEWLEDTCTDSNCSFCAKRPWTPYEAYYMIDMEVGSAEWKKAWRQENYQHKTNGMKKHKRKKDLIENIISDYEVLNK